MKSRSGIAMNLYHEGVPRDLSLLSAVPSHWWSMGDGDTFPILLDRIGSAHFTMKYMELDDIITHVP